jgi:hypothetical protein
MRPRNLSKPYHLIPACLLVGLLAAPRLSEAQGPNQTGTTPQNQSLQRPGASTPAQNQRRPLQSGNAKALATQPPANATHWQSLKNHVSQGGDSVKSFFSKRFGGHSDATPQQPATAAGHPLQMPAPSAVAPRSHAPRLAALDPHAVPGSGTSQDSAPLFPGHSAPATARSMQPPGGSVVHRTADGSNMYVHRSPDGTRQVLVERPDGSRVFAAAHGASYVQRPWNYQAQAFDRRTYTSGAQVTQQFYRQYSFNGTTLDAYTPQRYYNPGLYQWALNSRTQPVPASWNYVSHPTPWYNQYKGYFTPESSYTNPLAWMTDYLIANSLIASWNAHLKGAPASPASTSSPTAAAPTPGVAQGVAATSPSNQSPPDTGPEVTPEVKQKVAEEISRQVRVESAEAQANAQNSDVPAGKTGIVAELNERDLHTLVVASDLDLTDHEARRCSLSAGDVLQVMSRPNVKDNTAEAIVLASKNGECGRAAEVAVNLTDLQEMQNHMRETIDQGLADRAGKSGVQATAASFAAAAPAPEPDAAQQVDQQQKIAAAEG